jgi:hypothetical protein
MIPDRVAAGADISLLRLDAGGTFAEAHKARKITLDTRIRTNLWKDECIVSMGSPPKAMPIARTVGSAYVVDCRIGVEWGRLVVG